MSKSKDNYSLEIITRDAMPRSKRLREAGGVANLCNNTSLGGTTSSSEVNNILTALYDEKAARKSADDTLCQALGAEVLRAQSADDFLKQLVDTLNAMFCWEHGHIRAQADIYSPLGVATGGIADMVGTTAGFIDVTPSGTGNVVTSIVADGRALRYVLGKTITNDFTNAYKTKLDGIAAGANLYIHPTSGVTAGSYTKVTVDGEGHVTAGSNPSTLAGYGITDAAMSTHTHTLSIAANSGTSAINLAANTKYKLTAGGSTFIFTTPPDHTYTIASLMGSTAVGSTSSYVYWDGTVWKSKTLGTAAFAATGDFAIAGHSHTLSIESSTGTSSISLEAGGKYVLTAGGKTLIFTMPSHQSLTDYVLTTDSRLSDARPASDVSAWAKAENKPSYAWSEITNKPSTFTPSSHTHSSLANGSYTASAPSKTGTIALTSDIPTTLKSPYALTFGSKTYDGSAAKTITAADLSALTSHQTIYNLSLYSTTGSSTTKIGEFAPNGAAMSWYIVAGSNISLTNDATNHKVTIANTYSYTHPSHTAYSSGLYKITVDGLGHVTAATAIVKSDITALGIPSSDTNTHRPIQVDGTQILGNNTTALNLNAGTGISLSNSSGSVTITNAGVIAVTTGTANGTISVNIGGTSADVAVKGLGARAYDSTAYLPLTGGTLTGSLSSRDIMPSSSVTYDLGKSNLRYRGMYVSFVDVTEDISAGGEIVGMQGVSAAGINDLGSTDSYVLPVASSSTLGGIKLGHVQTAKDYAIQLDSSNKAYVNVPWTDTDTKNTAGATNSSSKLFLIGATTQGINPQTYSQDTAYVGTDGCLYSNGAKVLTAHQSVVNNVPTLSWGGTSTIGTVGGTALQVKMPANPNTDSKVKQEAVTASSYTNWRAIPFSYSNSATEGFTPTTATDQLYTTPTLEFQPSTGTLRVTILKSTAATGTAPLTVASTTMVTNLNAEYLGGTKKASLLSALFSSTTDAVSITIGGTTKTIAPSTLRTSLGLGSVYSHAHSDYVTAIGVDGNTLTWSKGGTAQTALTIPYATKAAQDDSGNIITSTYLPLSGGTLTGNIKTKNVILDSSAVYYVGPNNQNINGIDSNDGNLIIGYGTQQQGYNTDIRGNIVSANGQPIVTEGEWQTPTMSNGVADGFMYRKVGKAVHFKGWVNNIPYTAGVMLCTLPSGYYGSANSRIMPLASPTGYTCKLVVGSTGQVRVDALYNANGSTITTGTLTIAFNGFYFWID